MTQDQCLALPSHFIHLGICYPGNQAYLTLSNPNDPQPVNFHTNSVPEPATGALFMCALVMSVWAAHIRARSSAKVD